MYDALLDLNIGQKDPLYKPSFRKLLQICEIYANDIPRGPGATKILAKLAKEHAGQVIKTAKDLHLQ